MQYYIKEQFRTNFQKQPQQQQIKKYYENSENAKRRDLHCLQQRLKTRTGAIYLAGKNRGQRNIQRERKANKTPP